MSESEATQRPERKNLLLRMLINEMLTQVRDLKNQATPMSPLEREQAEEALERIMVQVRSEAVRDASA